MTIRTCCSRHRCDADQLHGHRVPIDPRFFDTVLAQAYVGYGASSLGLASEAGNPAPATGFNYYPDYDVYASTRGMPGTYLENAVPPSRRDDEPLRHRQSLRTR